MDAWLDTVPAGLSVRDPQQARQALHPLKEVATITDAAVLLLCHTNRVTTANARDRYGATGELRKKARMTLYAQTDEDGCLPVGTGEDEHRPSDSGVEVHHHLGAALRADRGPRRHRAAAVLRR